MDRASIRQFALRNRTDVQAGKRRFWAEQYRAQGPAYSVRISQVLWRHMRGVRPDWPTAHERAADLAHHVALKRTIDRAAHAFTTR